MSTPREVIAKCRCWHKVPAALPCDGCLEIADFILESLRSQGFAIVPREPTQEMINAADHIYNMQDGYASGESYWRVMIDAAEGRARSADPQSVSPSVKDKTG